MKENPNQDLLSKVANRKKQPTGSDQPIDKPGAKAKKSVPFNMYLSPELVEEIRRYCFHRRLKYTHFAQEAFEHYMKSYPAHESTD